MKDFEEPRRFWSKVDVGEVSECWNWQAAKSSGSYGQFSIHGRLWQAHRVAWVLTYGPIPEGLFVCHKCDNKGCCNPYHLFLGTNADNLADAGRKGLLSDGNRGERNPNSKLTEDDVLDIRKLYATGDWTQDELAEEFGVYHTAISQIINRKRWAWLK